MLLKTRFLFVNLKDSENTYCLFVVVSRKIVCKELDVKIERVLNLFERTYVVDSNNAIRSFYVGKNGIMGQHKISSLNPQILMNSTGVFEVIDKRFYFQTKNDRSIIFGDLKGSFNRINFKKCEIIS